LTEPKDIVRVGVVELNSARKRPIVTDHGPER
jgi:hypothetical protein